MIDICKTFSALFFMLIPFSSIAQNIECQGSYPYHLQGIDSDKKGSIYWSFTTALVKTNYMGDTLKTLNVPSHHGDLTFFEEKIYVAVNLGKFNEETGADSWVYIYSAQDLSLLNKIELPELRFGAGGITVNPNNDNFFIIGGLPVGYEENYVYEYDSNFNFRKKYTVKSGYTKYGIQTAFYSKSNFYFGCYGSPPITIITNKKVKKHTKNTIDISIGITEINGNYYRGLWDEKNRKGALERIEKLK